MAQLGRERSQKIVAQAKAQGTMTRTKGGQRLLKNTIAYFEEEVIEWIKAARQRPGPRHAALVLMKQLTPQVVSALAARTIMDGLSSVDKMTRLAFRIAGNLEDEAYYRAFEQADRSAFQVWTRRMKTINSHALQRRRMWAQGQKHNVQFAKWGNKQKLQLGVVLIEAFARSTGLIEIVTRRLGKKVSLEVVPTDAAMKALDSVNKDVELMCPIYLPCIEMPRPWVDPMTGGFLSAEVFRRALVKTSDRSYIEALMHVPMPGVYDAVNLLQQTPFSIHAKVLEVMEHGWEKNVPLPGFADRESLELPEVPSDIDTNLDARRRFAQRARFVYETNHRRKAEGLRTMKILHMARRFLGESIYYVQQLDFRGRCYSNAYYMHPQGEERCKALLQFAEGKPIVTDEAIAFYYMHGANCWGLDKQSYEARLAWVEENRAMILRVAEDPWEHRDWQDADSPWMFLAWAFDFAEWDADWQNHRSKIPVAQDATQSGIQILSMLLRDERGARATNCVPAEAPQDLYSEVAQEVVRRLEQDLSGAHEVWARFWLNLGVDRKATKRPTMTRVYNSTVFSCRAYVAEWANEVLKSRNQNTADLLPEGHTFPKAVTYLTDHVWAAMNTIISSTQVVMDWLSDVSDVFTSLDLPINWTTPIGFPVQQNYLKWKSEEVQIKTGSNIRYNHMQVETDVVDKRRSRQAMAPNYIHSLDASLMMQTCLLANAAGVTHFAMVHDSYATHAADAHLMFAAVREAAASTFSADVLADLKVELEAQLPPETVLPPLPDYGTFDPTVVRNSKYFFC